MNKKFKRTLSFILSFVMIFTCMTTMNVSTIFANGFLDHTWTFDADEEFGFSDGASGMYLNGNSSEF